MKNWKIVWYDFGLKEKVIQTSIWDFGQTLARNNIPDYTIISITMLPESVV